MRIIPRCSADMETLGHVAGESEPSTAKEASSDNERTSDEEHENDEDEDVDEEEEDTDALRASSISLQGTNVNPPSSAIPREASCPTV